MTYVCKERKSFRVLNGQAFLPVVRQKQKLIKTPYPFRHISDLLQSPPFPCPPPNRAERNATCGGFSNYSINMAARAKLPKTHVDNSVGERRLRQIYGKMSL